VVFKYEHSRAIIVSAATALLDENDPEVRHAKKISKDIFIRTPMAIQQIARVEETG
jgi:hypothetical protein